MAPFFGISDYQYWGMGSVWFSDFILAHKTLNISKMISMEKSQEYVPRMEFNKPYSCIDILKGESSAILPRLLRDNDSRLIVWLDYDGNLSKSVLQDLTVLTESVPNGSILLVTVNAVRKNLADTESPSSKEILKTLRSLLGDSVPNPLALSQLTQKNLPSLLALVLFNHLKRSTRISGRIERFIPLFNIAYKDDAQMMTVGGMIADELADKLLAQSGFEDYEYKSNEEQLVINIPHITLKEKLALDNLLPIEETLTADLVEETYSFRLNDAQLRDFQKYYLHYPTFGELRL